MVSILLLLITSCTYQMDLMRSSFLSFRLHTGIRKVLLYILQISAYIRKVLLYTLQFSDRIYLKEDY